MTQSRRISLLEAGVNVAVGYGIAVLIQIWLFPAFGLVAHLGTHLYIGALFTVASIARSYALRRLFEHLGARTLAQ